MSGKIKYLFLCAALVLAGCTESGPQKAINAMADAMNNNDSTAFLAQIDMNAFASNYIKNKTENDEALSSLNALGNMLGLGGIDNLIGSVVDIKGRLEQQLVRGVSSGELMAQCRVATTPDCPWVPQSLRDAEIVELGNDATIAKVTTPARLTSWLALRRKNDKWLIVGQAVLENQARDFALGNNSGAMPPQNQDNAKRPAPNSQNGKNGSAEKPVKI